MRRWTAFLVVLAWGCNSTGSEAQPGDAAVDATFDATSGSDGGPLESGLEGSSDSAPCLDIDASLPSPSHDCVYEGHCPANCSSGTASAYFCNVGPDASASYPGNFSPPSDSVDIIAYQAVVYPWDAGAYLSCAPLSCTRWATADHLDGGSAWSADPCADSGTATQAWACPTAPGVLPTVAGCVNAGDLQRIGGPGTGIPVNIVWCCPAPPGGADAGGEAGSDAAGDADDDAGD
jgi:hypothetical protein